MHPTSKYLLRQFILQRGVWTRVAAFISHLCNVLSPGLQLLSASPFHTLTITFFFFILSPFPYLHSSYKSCPFLSPLFSYFSPFTYFLLFFLIFFPYILAGLKGEVLCDSAEWDGSPEVLPGQRGMYVHELHMLGHIMGFTKLWFRWVRFQEVCKIVCVRDLWVKRFLFPDELFNVLTQNVLFTYCNEETRD